MTPILRLDGLAKSFGAVKVADDLGYELATGEALGVIGPNGAGKTSMFNLITGTLSPDQGRVQFDGQDVTRHSARTPLPCGHGAQFSGAPTILGHDGFRKRDDRRDAGRWPIR